MAKQTKALSKTTATTTEPRKPKARKRAVKATRTAVAPPTHEQIAQRAFELFVARGAHDGSAVADWLSAEAELTAR